MEKVDIIVEGFEPGVSDPAKGLMHVFGIDQATAQVIVQRVPLAVKRGVTLEAAQPFERALMKLGARVRLVAHGEPPPQRPQRNETSLDGTPVSSRRSAHIETALMHGGGWEPPLEVEDVPKVSLPAFRAVRPNTPAPADMKSSSSGAAWRPQTPPTPEIARSIAPPRQNTPAPIDMALPPPPITPQTSLANERSVLRSEPPPVPSFLAPDPMAAPPARASRPPEAPRSLAPAQVFEAPPAPAIELADDLPAESQRSGQWHAVRSPLEFDATSRTTPFADDLMLPWVGTTPEPARPTTPTRRKPNDRR